VKKTFIFAVMLFMTAAIAVAQDDEYPKFELSGMANMLVFDADVLQDETMWGYGIGAQYNVNKFFGIVGEWSTAHGESGPLSIQQPGTIVVIPKLDPRNHTLVFGPRFSYRTRPVTIFAHVLMGAGTNKLDDDIGTFNYDSYTKWQFSMAIGGGIDINLGKRFALRPAQFDYLYQDSDLTQLVTVGGAPGSNNNFRYMLGGVFKF
jgi:opacity protein-like surface antigen